MIAVTLWPDLSGDGGQLIEVADLATLAVSLTRWGEERRGWLWSPGVFSGPRSNATTVARTAVTLDHDNATVTLADGLSRIANAGHPCFGHPTRREGRWRIIAELPRPLSADEYQAVAQSLMPSIDAARESATPSQPWFLPLPGTAIEWPIPPIERAFADDYLLAALTYDGDWWFGWPKKADGSIDRSALDLLIVHRLVSHGCDDAVIREVIRARESLSHRTDRRYVDRMIGKVRAAATDHSLIIMLGPDIHRVTDEAISALSSDQSLFVRGGLSHVTGVIEAESESIGLAPESPVIRVVTEANLCERLSRAARWERYDARAKENVRAAPPRTIAQMILARGEWPLRRLAGVSETPIVRPDGSLADSPGYDPATGYLYSPSTSGRFAIASEPTRDDARAALALLADVYREFPFADPAMAYVPIAAVIALVCRPAVGVNVPLFAFDAPVKGSGKTLIANTVSLIATGRPAYMTSFPVDAAELGKRLDAYARLGAPLIAFDNADTPVCGASLDAALTCGGNYAFRILGQTEIVRCQWSSVIIVTGNQMAITGDTARRSLIARIVPREERPAERQGFDRPDLLAYVWENRAQLLGAAITVLRAYLLAGAPDQRLGMRGSFEPFIARVAGAIAWAGGASILDAWSVESRADDEGRAELATAIEWLAVRWPGGATSREIADDLEALMPSGEYAQAAEAIGVDRVKSLRGHFTRASKPGGTLAQAIGYVLRGWVDCYSGRLRMVRDRGVGGRGVSWRVSE